jgi:hypothetical protein
MGTTLRRRFGHRIRCFPMFLVRRPAPGRPPGRRAGLASGYRACGRRWQGVPRRSWRSCRSSARPHGWSSGSGELGHWRLGCGQLIRSAAPRTGPREPATGLLRPGRSAELLERGADFSECLCPSLRCLSRRCRCPLTSQADASWNGSRAAAVRSGSSSALNAAAGSPAAARMSARPGEW